MKYFLALIVAFFLTYPLFAQRWIDSIWVKSNSGLEYKIERKGSGDTLSKGESIKIHWIWFDCETGKKLMSSYDYYKEGQLWEVNSGTFVKGFEEGLLLLRKGGDAFLKIPPSIAYGDEGIQGQTTFCYYIKILSD